MKLSLSARDHSYPIKAGFKVHLLTPSALIALKRLEAYMDEALGVFGALLDNELTLTLHYRFGGERQKFTRTRPSVLGEPVMYRLQISTMTNVGKTISTSLPGARSSLPSGQRLNKRFDYWQSREISEINHLREFILHPEFRWTSQLNAPATSIRSIRW